MGNSHAKQSSLKVERDECQTEYGRNLKEPDQPRRAEVALKTGTVEEDVMSYLVENVECFRANMSRLPDLGFRRCNDNPLLPRHIYFEGYFHAMPLHITAAGGNGSSGGDGDGGSCGCVGRGDGGGGGSAGAVEVRGNSMNSSEPVRGESGGENVALQTTQASMGEACGGCLPYKSINPRLGVDMAKPAAPRPLRAFYEIMRRKNVEHLRSALEEHGEQCRHAQILLRLLDDDRAFADLAIQIHAGTAVTEEHISWHVDTHNSILHLALAIRGTRALHSMRSVSQDVDAEEVVEWQKPGDVYISSPAFFQHGVQYPQAYRWSKRIIAIQARILFDQAEFSELMQSEREPGAYDWLETFSKALASKPAELPSLGELKAVDRELAKQEADIPLSGADMEMLRAVETELS